MTTSEALRAATHALAHTDAPRVTAEALLAHCLGLRRAQLLSQGPAIPAEAAARFQALVGRAAEGEPLAYLTGRREFHGLDFAVDARVLIPRPETELLVDEALAWLPTGGRVLDVGTGSGCIAVTVAVKCPAARVTAVDISDEALAVARANALRHGVADRLTFIQSDLLAAVPRPAQGFNLICANLPYIPTERLRGLPVTRHEPGLALDGGPDGLALIRRLLSAAPTVLAPGGGLLLEIEASQGAAALAEAQAAFPAARIELRRDYAGLDRIVSLRGA